jgi:hypothetical protein
VGRWTAAIQPQTGATDNLTLSINVDGSFAMTLTGTGSCSGTLSYYSGLTWTSTASGLSVAGSSMCSGAGVTCPGPAGTLTCGSTPPSSGACIYALSSNDNTLVLNACSDTLFIDGTYSRGP